MSQKNELISYPAEVTFKSVFRNGGHTHDSIISIIREYNVEATVENRPSREGKFVSYTVSGVFPSHDVLTTVCSRIASLELYMTMF